MILDCHFGPIPDLQGLTIRLDQRAGIVEHGLFLDLTTDLVVKCPVTLSKTFAKDVFSRTAKGDNWQIIDKKLMNLFRIDDDFTRRASCMFLEEAGIQSNTGVARGADRVAVYVLWRLLSM